MWKDFSDMVFEQWFKGCNNYFRQIDQLILWAEFVGWLQRNYTLKRIALGNVAGDEVRELVEIELFNNLWVIINLLVG